MATTLTSTSVIFNDSSVQSAPAARNVLGVADGPGFAWFTLSSSTRLSGTTYTNTTGAPILLAITNPSGSNYIDFILYQYTIGGDNHQFSIFYNGGSFSIIIPPGAEYRILYYQPQIWRELRSLLFNP
jgi:hypothetical protein